MTEKEIKNTIEYWKTTAERDYNTMLGLFKIKRFPESLFFGHIVLEKILKSLVVKNTKEQAPYVHDLARLADLAEINLNIEEIKFLKLINGFNIKARYPEHRLKIYKEYGKKNTEKMVKKITSLYKKLCQRLK